MSVTVRWTDVAIHISGVAVRSDALAQSLAGARVSPVEDAVAGQVVRAVVVVGAILVGRVAEQEGGDYFLRRLALGRGLCGELGGICLPFLVTFVGRGCEKDIILGMLGLGMN